MEPQQKPIEMKSPGNIIATRPFHIVDMDFKLPLPESYNGNTALLLFTCMFSGYVILAPMSDTSVPEVAKVYLDNVYRRFGAEDVIWYNRDPRFMSNVFRAFNRKMRHWHIDPEQMDTKKDQYRSLPIR